MYLKYGKKFHAKKRYGIEVEQYDEMMSLGVCAICGTTEGRMCLDHCHTTNVVRGCLCHKCNTALGLFDDNIEKMHEAINYLKRFKI